MSLPRVRPVVAAFLGGKVEGAREIEFAYLLGARLISETSLLICVTGYRGKPASDGSLAQPSFSYCVVEGARHKLEGDAVEARIVTKPVSVKQPSAKRFEAGSIVTPRGRNEKSRLLSVIAEADVICLATGAEGSKEIFYFARALNKPVLPLPFLGGASRDLWGRHHQELAGELGIDLQMAQRWHSVSLKQLGAKKFDELVSAVVTSLVAAVKKRCLVCMPFSIEFQWVYERVIVPAAEIACVELSRLDLQRMAGDIGETFKSELAGVDMALAVVTGERPNVLYEIGFAHAIGKQVLLLSEMESQPGEGYELPFYVRNHRTILYPSSADEERIASSQRELGATFREMLKGPRTTRGEE